MDRMRERHRAWRALAAALLAVCLALGLAVAQPQQAQADSSGNASFTVKTMSAETYQVSAYMLFSAEVDGETNAASAVSWNDAYKDVVYGFITSPEYGSEYRVFLTKRELDDDAMGALGYISEKIESDVGLATVQNGHKAVGGNSFAMKLAKAIVEADPAREPTVAAKSVMAGTGTVFGNATDGYLTDGFYLFYGEGLPPIWTSVGGTENEALVKDTLQLAALKQVWDEQSHDWGKIAAAGNGQTVRFRVTGEAPNLVPPEGTSFSYTLADTLPTGLTAGSVEDVKVYATDDPERTPHKADITAYFRESTGGSISVDTDVNKLTATCKDLFATDGGEANFMRSGNVTHIVFEYDATVNAVATAGTTYNANTAVISYKKGSIESSTAEATAKVATFAIVLRSTDNSEPVRVLRSPSEFTLTTMIDGKKKYVTSEGTLADDPYTFEAEGEVVVYGIPAGVYTLTEVKPPEGYKMPAVATTNITISAVFDQDGGALTDIEVTQDNASSVAVEKDVVKGMITVSVQNEPKTVLPITGMEPSQLGTIIGALLVAAGIVALLIRARRKARA